jgi:pimeloyl-ACP methyl ester carboxylesterase
VLDAYGIAAAHVVGVSAGGAFAQRLALEHADRVRSHVLISTSPATSGDRDLASPTDAFGRFASTADVDWSDRESVIEYLVAYAQVLAGGRRPFDEAAMRDLVRRDVERAHDAGAAQNHDLLTESESPRGPLASIDVPTLVIHGTADPLFGPDHGDALVEEIPGARLLRLEDAGHGVERADWAAISRAIVAHTG